ncbi:MAG: hypothetical protein HP477_14855 [Nitrospira sp.]|nr:hypothetical protein [Nitrospira sp.]
MCKRGGTYQLPEAELESHLAATRATILDMLAVNQVVKAKVEQECDRARSLIMACSADGAANATALDELKAERAVLKHKTMALSVRERCCYRD